MPIIALTHKIDIEIIVYWGCAVDKINTEIAIICEKVLNLPSCDGTVLAFNCFSA